MPSAIAILKDLVAINSINPDCQPDAPGEAEVARYITRLLQRHGIDFQTQEVFPRRHNIIATLDGRDPAQRLLFEAHMDTVSAQGMSIPPFTPTERDGKLYGRGACDTKASLAAMLAALLATKENTQRTATIVLLAAVDEEIHFSGSRRFAKDCGKFSGAVIGEPTQLDVINAHKGCVRLRVGLRGKAAHTARPDLGVNAISKAARLITAIETELLPRVHARTHATLGRGERTVSLIGGGTQINFVPDQCWLEMDCRTLPGEDACTVRQELAELLDALKKRDPAFTAQIDETLLDAPPVETSADEPIARVALDACRRLLPATKMTSAPYATDASQLTRAATPCIVLGPGSIEQAHTATEWVEVRQVELAVQIYQRIMEQF